MKNAVILVFIGISAVLFIVFFHQKTRVSIPEFRANPTNKQNAAKTVILLGGDVMLGRSVTVQALDRTHDATFPFRNLQALFDESDLIFVNLENPIIENCPRQTSGMVFCAPPEMLTGFVPQKTIVNLANNHTQNHGSEGVLQTSAFLTSRDIAATGLSNLVIKTIHGTSFGFIGFDKSQNSSPALSLSEQTLITNSKRSVDVLIVALHWGIEYQKHPTEGQKKLSNEIISLGANVIAGHHPHWVQDIEWIGTKPIYYSLGNLIFDQMWSEETRQGLLVKLTFNGKNIEKQELIPTYITEIGQPIIMPSPNE